MQGMRMARIFEKVYIQLLFTHNRLILSAFNNFCSLHNNQSPEEKFRGLIVEVKRFIDVIPDKRIKTF